MTNFDYTAKIAGLLAKAAGTTNEDEAATYRAKASELMLKMQIDQADLDRALKDRQPTPEEIIPHVVLGLQKGAYVIKAKRDIVFGLAPLFNCRVTIAADRSSVKLYGYESDVQFVQALMSSLIVQLDGQLASMPGDRSFKTSFAHGFASRVVARMRNARYIQEAEADVSTPGTALMLIDRKGNVDKFVENYYTGTKLRSSYKNRSIRSAAGVYAGQAAGDRADIGQTRIANGERKSIS
jgi:hypothetical protein